VEIKPTPDSTAYVQSSVTLDYTIAPNINVELGILPEFPIRDETILKVFKSKNIALDMSQFEVRPNSVKNDGSA